MKDIYKINENRNTFLIKKISSCAIKSIAFMFVFLMMSGEMRGQCSFASANCTWGDQIENFSTTGGITNITNNGSGCSPDGYGDFTHMELTVEQGQDFNFSVQTEGSYSQGFAIFIDWNQDGTLTEAWNSETTGTSAFTGTISVPAGAELGSTIMRVVAGYNCVPNNPCSTCSTFGEAEDYTVNVNAAPILSVSPSSLNFGYTAPDDNSASQTYALTGNNLDPADGNITVTAPAGFEVSLDNSTWSGSVTPSYTGSSISETIYVRFSPTGAPADFSGNVTNAGGGATTQNVAVTGTSILEWCDAHGGTWANGITRVIFNTINNPSSGEGGYTDFTHITTTVQQGQTYPISVYLNTGGNYTDYARVWIDWNQNGIFEESERYDLGLATNVTDGITSLSPHDIIVPMGAQLGETRMRVISSYFAYLDNPCTEGSFDGEVEDYTVNVVATCNAPTPEITGVFIECAGTPITFQKSSCDASNICYWQSSATGTQTTNSDNTYITSSNAGTYTIFLRPYNPIEDCWGTAAQATGIINSVPIANAGSNSTICNGNDITLNASPETQTIFTENFEGGSILAGWSNDPQWYITTGVVGNGNYSALIEWSSVAQNQWLISPILSFPDGAGEMELLAMFMGANDFNFQWIEHNYIKISTDGGTTWTTIADLSYDYPNAVSGVYNSYTFDLSSFIDPGSNNVKIGFHRVTPDGGSAYWGLDDIVIKGPNITYAWTSNPPVFNSTDQNPTFNPNTTTTFTLVATSNGCSDSDEVTITVHQPPTAVSSISGTDLICAGESTVLTAVGGNVGSGANYQWGTGAVGTNIIVGENSNTYTTPQLIENTNYWVRRVGTTTCIDPTAGTTQLITVQSPPVPTGLSAGDFFWTGAHNTEWNNTANWLQYNGTVYHISGLLPSNSTDVFIQSYGGSCATTNAVTSAGTTVHAKDVNIATGLTLGGLSNIELSGNWNNSGAFVSGTGTVQFTGNTQQQINPGASSFNNVVFDNSSTGTNNIIVNEPMIIDGTATFTNGIINFDGTGSLTFGDDAISNEGAANSFVNGEVSKIGSSAFTFPIGDVRERDLGSGVETYKIWAPFEATPASETTVSVEYRFTNDGLPTWWYHDWTHEYPVNHTSDQEYWMVNSGADLSNVKLYWKESEGDCVHTFCAGGDVALDNVTITYWDEIWKDAGGSITGNNEVGFIESTIPFIAFSANKSEGIPIGFGGKDAENPLPIVLLNFEATCKSSSAIVSWVSATEINNDYYILEKSKDAINWFELARIDGAGFSNIELEYEFTDNSLFAGENYYRLTQVDYDGTSETFNIIHINCDEYKDGKAKLSVFPNPFRSEINVFMEDIEDEILYFEIYDELGKLIYKEKYNPSSDNNKHTIQLEHLPPAMYYFRAKSQRHLFNNKIIKH